MANQFSIPYSNPVRFYEMNKTEVAQYLTRHFDDYSFRVQNAAKPWMSQTLYKQKWQTSDITYFQFQSDFEPIQVEIIDCYGIARLTQLSLQVRAHKYIPNMYIYQNSISWAAFSPGTYYFKITLAGNKVLISEPQEIKVMHKHTALIEYKNNRYHADVVYETGIKFGFRVEGTFGELEPGSRSVIYKDQRRNPSILSSTPYKTFPFYIGASRGCPSWVYDILNFAWSCNEVTVDGKNYAWDVEEPKFEFNTQERWQLRGAVMELTEGINRGSKYFTPTLDPNKRVTLVYQIDGTIYGDLSSQAGSNIVPILSSE